MIIKFHESYEYLWINLDVMNFQSNNVTIIYRKDVFHYHFIVNLENINQKKYLIEFWIKKQ